MCFPQLARDTWFHHWPVNPAQPDSTDWLQLGETPAGYLLRFPSLADFEFVVAERLIRCVPACDLPESTLNHLLLDQVLPLVVSEFGHCILHASAISLAPGTAIAIAAPTGFGKSTLAAAIAQRGGRLLTDDGLLLRECARGGVECLAGYPGIRLWESSSRHLFGDRPRVEPYAHYSQKQRIALTESSIAVHTGSAGLSRLYFISPPDGTGQISINPLSSQEAFLELVKFTFVLDVRSRQRLTANFAFFSQLAAFPIYFRLGYPREWERLPEVVDAIFSHASRH